MAAAVTEMELPSVTVEPEDSHPFNLSEHVSFDDLHVDSNFAILLISLISAMVWIIYITYYNSRVIGYIVTRLLKRFYITKGHLNIGSFTVSALSGKIMFKDIVYITHDYTIRIQDGWLIFRWWRSYVPKDVSEDLSHSDTRLSVLLNGLELHVYNRSQLYSRLERVFGLDLSIIPSEEMVEKGDVEAQIEDSVSHQNVSIGTGWRDLIPVIKVDISSGRFVFGNRLIPTTLSINVEEAHCVYSTKPAASKLDHFMHFVKCKAENFKVILAPSPKYTGIVDEPPRYMGAGFVVFSSNKIELYYYMDEPGKVPKQPEMLRLANGDIVESAPPIWGIDIKCGKGTDFSYGPWADRQREHLFKFFFPPDYQPLQVTKPLEPGEKRQVQSFDIRLSTLHESTIDILFTKNKETNAVHVNIGPGSYLEVTLPWVIGKDGYTTKVTGQLLHLEATTSLQFRSLVENETLEFTARCHYPIWWNDHQEWLLNLTGCKVTGWFVYAHKEFFEDLINDWSSKVKPDLLKFIPYTWRLTILLKEFEVLTQSNEYNWVDCSSQNQENAHIAVCGDLFDFSLDLPFVEFLPPTIPLRFWIQGESVDLAIYLPEVYTSRNILLSLDKSAKLLSRNGAILHPRPQDNGRKWRNVCKRSAGWVDFWSIPIAALSISYTYHPLHPYGPTPQADITTPEKEEILLSPMRIPRTKIQSGSAWSKDQKFDPSSLEPDVVSLELEIGPSVMFLYGTCLLHLLHLKENIFGEDQTFTDMNETPSSNSATTAPPPAPTDSTVPQDEDGKKEFDPRVYRPLDIIVSVTMHDIQAHLMKACTDQDPPCPVILLERFGFEMKIEYKEMQLQLLLSPAILVTTDKVNRPSKDGHLKQGHIMLSGLQLRGHGIFSDTGRTLEQKTLEYAWMLEIQIGKLTGKLTAPQLFSVVVGVETLVLLMTDNENKFKLPRLPQECLHSVPPNECPESDPNGSYRCPSSNDVKYRMTRCAIDAVDFYIVEAGTAINLWASPIRIACCNLHGNHVKNGITSMISAIRIRQMIAASSHVCNQHVTGSNSNTNTTCSGKSQHRGTSSDGSNIWLEVGSVTLGPLIMEAASSLSNTDRNLHLVQHKFLKFHDERCKKLWFLWPSDSKQLVTGRCGCVGGCVFFGRNRNGQRFFKPSRQDVQEGINVAAFRINEPGKEPGFGQSIVHDSQLVFHTPPYNSLETYIHDQPPPIWTDIKHQKTKTVGNGYHAETLSSVADSPPSTLSSSVTPGHTPNLNGRSRMSRRFSYTSPSANARHVISPPLHDVPYSRLVDSSPAPSVTFQSTKLDLDSRISTGRASVLSVPETGYGEVTPKSSVSDSKLMVDYFNNKLKTQTREDVAESTALGSSSTLSGTENKSAAFLSDDVSTCYQTVSPTSENLSEAFFTAEDFSQYGTVSQTAADCYKTASQATIDQYCTASQATLSQSRFPSSRSSSLRGSVVSSPGTYPQDSSLRSKRFGSDINILPEHAKGTRDASDKDGSHLSSYRSDHEIHTAEHRSSFSRQSFPHDEKTLIADNSTHRPPPFQRSVSERSNPKTDEDDDDDTLVQDPSGLLIESSDSHSISSTSFISAVSSQEDLTLVNLHMQVNKPIIDSPLLMSTYVNHLSQVCCNNWNSVSLPPGSDVFTVPIFQKSGDGRLVFISSRYLPRFESITEGFTTLKMINRVSKDGDSYFSYPLDTAQPDIAITKFEDLEPVREEELLSLRNQSGVRTTVIVKMKGDIDIMITPLVLESLQRFTDSITSTLSNLHPITALNHIHTLCTNKVESANILKKDQYLSQLQGGGSKRSTAERIKTLPKDLSGKLEPYNVYEEYISTQIQGTISLPRINIAVLQASIVEEVISFSALDNFRDLTCVSLLAVCFDEITVQFHYSKQAREVVQSFHRPTIPPSGQKKGVLSRAAGKTFLGLHFPISSGKNNVKGEPVFIETSEKQQEETAFTFDVGKTHVQLRRLRNECSVLKDAVITAIPATSSKVLFRVCPFRSIFSPPPSAFGDNTFSLDTNTVQHSSTDEASSSSEDKMGFIMMECSFEGVSFKLVKRSKFEKENEEETNLKKEKDPNAMSEGKPSTPCSVNQKIDSKTGKDEHSSDGPGSEPPKNMQNHDGQKKDTTEAPAENVSNKETAAIGDKMTDENALSCIIQVKQVWFNFAAPPLTPITRKIDYTRLDWNLLSTASPAINAWMNPSNRFAIRLVYMLQCYYRRCTAVVTCLMAEALDIQSLHMPSKSRYGKLTPLAKTLQEDPSCQLCNILTKYLLVMDKNIEDNLKENDLPHLSILRQGVIVLSRQWKNVLYTPLLLEHNFKSKRHPVKPFNVMFAVPEPDEDNTALTDGEGEGYGSCEECEVTDECAMLLNPSGSSSSNLYKALKNPSANKYASGTLPVSKSFVTVVNELAPQRTVHSAVVESGNVGNNITFGSPTSPVSGEQQPGAPPRRKRKLLPTQQPSSSRASVVFPIKSDTVGAPVPNTSPQHHTTNKTSKKLSSRPSAVTTEYGLPPSGSVPSLSAITGMPDKATNHSILSLEQHNVSPPNTGSGNTTKPSQGEDLYTWMVKQGFEDQSMKITESKVARSTFWDLPKEETGTVMSNTPVESPDYDLLAAAGYSLYPMHDNLRLLDAHLIFEPFLSSLGVMPQQMITSSKGGGNGVTLLDSWGSNLTLVGNMESIRIDIVVSEFDKASADSDCAKKSKQPKQSTCTTKGNNKPPGKITLEIPSEIPAFLCERINIECDAHRAPDMTVVEDLSRQRRNMLYVSRGQLKKNSNTALNISISAHCISQQVNMPLLRLLHQISNMYENVKETQTELREQGPSVDIKIPLPKPRTCHVDSDLRARNPPPVNLDRKPPVYPQQAANGENKDIASPPPSARGRHQSFAQRLRSTSRSVRGYISLNTDTPIFSGSRLSSVSDDKSSVIPTKDEDISPPVDSIPKCWKTVYYLLDLYATMPTMKTLSHRISVAGDASENLKLNSRDSKGKYDTLQESKSSDDAEKVEVGSTPVPRYQNNSLREERTRLLVFAVARIHRTRLLATLSGLKLEAEITNLHSSLTCRKKVRPVTLEYSVTGQIGKTMIVLLEGVAPNQQTVVKVTVGKSQTLYSSMSRRGKDKNSALLTIGDVNVDIPQHPVALHGMMTRGTKELSSTLQELRVNRSLSKMSRGATVDEPDAAKVPPKQRVPRDVTKISAPKYIETGSHFLQPLVMHFTGVIQSLSITASLLPSLQAQYKMEQLTSNGSTGSKAKFVVDLPRHSLSFSTKVQVTETNLPSEASIELPNIHVGAEYVQDGGKLKEPPFGATEGAVLREGNYLSAVADIGEFEHSLTTDLLNHLMFVQQVFMKEVNEVVRKVYGGEKPVPIWLEDDEEETDANVKRFLFSLMVRLKHIQLTATTPTNCAVRFETGSIEFQVSNRIQNVSGSSMQSPSTAKLFFKTQFDVNLSLGQLIRNPLFEEADSEFQQFAFFKTSICLRNAIHGEMVREGEDKEVILITLRRPLIYVQPVAVDKAILVWLNYKNAYEYWNEQRSSLNKEIISATQQGYEKIIFEKIATSSSLGVLFLQLTVDDMGICVPLNPLPLTSWGLSRSFFPEVESCAAVVVTLESTSISACSSGSLVSKGKFIGLCLRFADDFETSLDDWKPDTTNEFAGVLMNFCSVSEGTYEVCSRTTSPKSETENAKWFLNVQWQMEGVDIHLDVNIGKQLSALGHTLTSLTSVQEDENLTACFDSDDNDDNSNTSEESLTSKSNADTITPPASAKKRTRHLEKEMYEQTKIINDLRMLGASQGVIEQELKRLHELETLVFREFRRDMIQKLRRQSVKGKYQLKDKFGIGKKGPYRSKSFVTQSPTSPKQSKENFVVALQNMNSKQTAQEAKMPALQKVSFGDRSIRRQISLPSPRLDAGISEDDKSQLNDISDQEHELEDTSLTEDELPSTNDSSTLLDDSSSKDQQRSVTSSHHKAQEPNIDFELDVKVFINSGKCVLHTKDQAKEDELKIISKMKKDRSASSGQLEMVPTSPNLSRRSHKDKHLSAYGIRSRHHHTTTINPAQLVELTVFHIPGLDVKVHYESKTVTDGNLSPCYTVDSSGIVMKKTGAKKASLFAWITLQSIPEETIISPHILEFLEQTLQPIPEISKNHFGFQNSTAYNHSASLDRNDDLFAKYISSGQYVYASFPVDVIVYFHMQPSTFRFSCLPVSRVECMLKLPSLDMVFSSKRADTSDGSENKVDSSALPVAIGGLSITGVMADFSLYIFHPYGGKKTSASIKDTQTMWAPLADSERKDSLSVNVEFVKFHLSRSRKLNFENITNKSSDQSQAIIRFSTVVNIGSASFKYDMRRLTEILAFPKAWYRRSIISKLFLGDLSRAPVYSDEKDESSTLDVNEDRHFKNETSDERKIEPEKERPQERQRFPSSGKMSHSSESELSAADRTLQQNTSWQTLVLFSVNFNKLNVHMNMGNVVGNVMWLTKDFHSEGRLSVGSNGYKNVFIGLGFGGSSLDAKGGIVGGVIELSKIDAFASVHEDPGTEPDHTVGAKLFALELRLDYMGTGILMFRISSLNMTLRDEWKVTERRPSSESPRRPAMVFAHGDLSWDQLQIMISKSTAVDLIKMYYKLEEFFSQQFKSSKRVFTSLQQEGSRPLKTSPTAASSSFKKNKSQLKRKATIALSESAVNKNDATHPQESPHHHRHWQLGLKEVAGLRLSAIKYALPSYGTVLGGTMDLHGNNISLACFHGINFKSKSWALFSLKEPSISFVTEAQEVPDGEGTNSLKAVQILQTLTFSLGMTSDANVVDTRHHHYHHYNSMATICRVSRNVLFPPQFRSMQEWFHYAFVCSDIDAVDRFPSLERERAESNPEVPRCRTPKSQETVAHTKEVIFSLPSLQLHLKTEHLQPATPPSSADMKPIVECSFITDFEDHILVTVDAEAYFFLHDLITSYLREKERASNSASHRAYSPSPDVSSRKRGGSVNKKEPTDDDIEELYSTDWRVFQCKTWHLEPTVRFLSWGGKSIEPYGVDYILQKLGFSHARTTIPKWMQRGFMDPLDKVLSLLVIRILALAREEQKSDTSKNAQ